MQVAQWRNQALETDCQARDKLLAVIGESEAAWEALEKRFDFPADRRREELRAKLPPLYSKQTAIERRIVRGLEVERLINDVLWPLHTQKLASLQRRFTQIVASAAPPADAAFVELCRDNLEVERLRLILYETTQMAQFRRGFDVTRMLRSHWADVQQGRERLFSLVGPGHKPKFDAPWLADAHRLTELRDGTTQEEMANAR